MSQDSDVRPKLGAVRTSIIRRAGRPALLLQDPLGLSQEALVLPPDLSPLLTLMDGTRTEGELRAALEVRMGIRLSPDRLAEIVSRLDEALFLENARYRAARTAALEAYWEAPARRPALAGRSYPAAPGELHASLGGYLRQVPSQSKPEGPIVGLVSPHIDYARGGTIYAQVWGAARETIQEIELAIILGTDHLGGEELLTLTRQHYATPFGILPTSREVVEELARALGEEHAFADELHHCREHSIELSAIWLHHFLRGRRCELVPILCGSFQPFIERGESPSEDSLLAAAIEVLKEAISGRPSLVIASADLAHMGPAFGDPRPLDYLERARDSGRDQSLLEAICAGDAEEAFRQVAAERDRRRICGLPSIYLALKIMGAVKGESLAYSQCPADEVGGSFVSICGIVFTSE